MTKRVRAAGDPAGMNSPTRSALETCQAVMIGLGTRRFVIVRSDDVPTGLRRIAPSPVRIRDLLPGDEVVYKGQRHVVRSIQPY